MERGRNHHWTWRRLAHEQDGLLREAVFFLVLVSVFSLFIFDIITVVSTHHAVKEDAKHAAKVAVTTFVSTGSDATAQQAALDYLKGEKTTMVSFTVDRSQGVTVYTVTAKRSTKTFLLKYIARLPKVGHWMNRQLHPVATAETR